MNIVLPENATIDDCLHEVERALVAANAFYGHGTDNAWDEAVVLVLGALGLPLDSDASIAKRIVNKADGAKIIDWLGQRVNQHKPLPYITHEAWFMGLPFYVDERVLIPRSPFAEWITRQFAPWLEVNTVKHILEIGTGSGCMAIAAAHAFKAAEIDAVDIDDDALAVAKINVDKHHMQQRVNLLRSDCFDNVASKQYDLIIANPPYVGNEEMASLPQEYYHEPRAALYADDNGLAIAKRILTEASRFLSPEGVLVMEVGNSDHALQECYQDVPFVWLEQEHGGHGLLLLSARDVATYFGES